MENMTNKYKGKCASCTAVVAAEAGFYINNRVWCEEPTTEDFGNGLSYACTAGHALNKKFAEYITELNNKTKAERAAYLLTDEGKAEAAAKEAKDAERNAKEIKRNKDLAARGLKSCTRCGGEGSSEMWAFSGHTCYKCGGTGYVKKTTRAKK